MYNVTLQGFILGLCGALIRPHSQLKNCTFFPISCHKIPNFNFYEKIIYFFKNIKEKMIINLEESFREASYKAIFVDLKK